MTPAREAESQVRKSRIAHWQTALHNRATALLGTPFAYGQSDCPMVCFELYDAMTGADLAGTYRGQWSDRMGAMRYVRKHDTDLLRALEAQGCTPVDVGFQQVGDFILTEDDTGWIRGHVCLGERCISSTREDGISLVDTSLLLACGQKIHVRRIT